MFHHIFETHFVTLFPCSFQKKKRKEEKEEKEEKRREKKRKKRKKRKEEKEIFRSSDLLAAPHIVLVVGVVGVAQTTIRAELKLQELVPKLALAAEIEDLRKKIPSLS